MTRIGELRVTSAADYGRTGFAVEQYRCDQSDEPCWCIPGWVEDQWGQSGFFATEDEARDFIATVTQPLHIDDAADFAAHLALLIVGQGQFSAPVERIERDKRDKRELIVTLAGGQCLRVTVGPA